MAASRGPAEDPDLASCGLEELAYAIFGAGSGAALTWRGNLGTTWDTGTTPNFTNATGGAAVFNESNGYLSVWHMNEPVKDEVGTLTSTDVGTTTTEGMIGAARRSV